MSDRRPDAKDKDPKSETLRRLAFDELYLLPGTQERGESTVDIEAELESLAPIDRERAMRMALRRLAFQILFERDARGSEDEQFSPDTIARDEARAAEFSRTRGRKYRISPT